jgi:hypothetical protein
VTFAAAETQKQITVPIRGDTTFDVTEGFVVTLSNAVNATIVNGQASGTIVDDDAQPMFSIADAAVVEGDSGQTAAVFAVTLSAPADSPLAVSYATFPDTAATGFDFMSTSGSLHFSPGSTLQTIAVPVLSDTTREPNETFAVALSNASSAGIADGSAVGTIQNDDPLPRISVDDVAVGEGSPAIFTVSLSHPSYQTVSVSYSTLAATATPGSDFGSVTGTLSFSPGATVRTVTVGTGNDTVFETNETFVLSLSNSFNADIIDGQGIGTIVNNDPEPEGMVASEMASENDGHEALREAEVAEVLAGAMAQWRSALGVGDPRLDRFDRISVSVRELDGAALAYGEPSSIILDADAAGHGWYVDPSPADSLEFSAARRDGVTLRASGTSAAAGRMDLLTVIMHELGHSIGLDHDDARKYAVMREELAPGTRYTLDVRSAPARSQDAHARNPDAWIAWQIRADLGWRLRFGGVSGLQAWLPAEPPAFVFKLARAPHPDGPRAPEEDQEEVN